MIETRTRQYQLLDGRTARVPEDGFNQKQMFSLRSGGLVDPANEGIMTLRDISEACQSRIFRARFTSGMVRSSEYAFYPRGFDNASLPLGDKLAYVEKYFDKNGERRTETHILEIPDVPVELADGSKVGLRNALGMGVIPIGKLALSQIDENTDMVSVTADFDPATDIKAVDIARPMGWALPDSDGYPLRSRPSAMDVPEARFSWVLHSDKFEDGSTGWHGTVCCYLRTYKCHDPYLDQGVYLQDTRMKTYGSVIIVSRENVAPFDTSAGV